jgi:hypothetical protein
MKSWFLGSANVLYGSASGSLLTTESHKCPWASFIFLFFRCSFGMEFSFIDLSKIKKKIIFSTLFQFL